MATIHYYCDITMKVLIVIILLLSYALGSKLPTYFKKCYRNDPNFQACLTEATQLGFSETTHPIPELNLVTIDPLEFSEFTIAPNVHGAINLSQKYKNCKLYGASKSKVQKVHLDFSKNQINFVVIMPEVKKVCQYELDGKFMLLPVVGQGTSTFVLQNVYVDFYLEYEEIKKKQQTFAKIVWHKLSLKPEHCWFEFENLFNGDKMLGDNLNKLLNDNWRSVYDDLRPSYEQVLGLILQSILNGFFSKLSFEDAFD